MLCVASLAGADARLGEVPVAFVVADATVADADLDAACRRLLAAYKVPVAYHRVDVLPRSEVGKVLRGRGVPRSGSRNVDRFRRHVPGR